MSNETPTKCAHPACECLISGESKHCSQYCKEAADLNEIACQCGHPECATETVYGSHLRRHYFVKEKRV